jgi:hypothetical protein
MGRDKCAWMLPEGMPLRQRLYIKYVENSRFYYVIIERG